MNHIGDPISSPTYDFIMGIAAFRGYDGVRLPRAVKRSRNSRKRKRQTRMKLI